MNNPLSQYKFRQHYTYIYIVFVLIICLLNIASKFYYGPFNINQKILLLFVFSSIGITYLKPKISWALVFIILAFGSGAENHVRVLFDRGISNTLPVDTSLLFVFTYFVFHIISTKVKREYAFEKLDRFFLLFFFISLAHYWSFFSMFYGILTNLQVSQLSLGFRDFIKSFAFVHQLGWRHDYHNIRYMLHYTLACSMSVIALHTINTETDVKIYFFRPLIFTSISTFSFALFSKYFQLGFHQLGKWELGVNSIFPGIHAFGNFSMIIFFAALLALSKLSHYKIYLQVAAMISLYFIYLSGSRSSIIFTFIGVFMALIYKSYFENFKKHSLRLIYTSSLVSLLILMSPRMNVLRNFDLSKIESFDHIDRLFSYRLGIYNTGLNMLFELPLTGVGIGNFFRYSTDDQFSPSKFLKLEGGENAHNYFLQTLCEQGVVGLLLLLILLAPLASKSDKKYSSICRGCSIGVILGNIVGHTLMIPYFLVLLFTSTVIFISMSEHSYLSYLNRFKKSSVSSIKNF